MCSGMRSEAGVNAARSPRRGISSVEEGRERVSGLRRPFVGFGRRVSADRDDQCMPQASVHVILASRRIPKQHRTARQPPFPTKRARIMHQTATGIAQAGFCTGARGCRSFRKPPLLCSRTVRSYASHEGASSTSRRRQITVTSDDGRINWGDLSAREKAARTTQQSFNFLIIVAGALGTVGTTFPAHERRSCLLGCCGIFSSTRCVQF